MAYVSPKIEGRRPIRDNILGESMSGSRSIPGSPGLSKKDDFVSRQSTSIPKSMTFTYCEEKVDTSRFHKASHESSYERNNDINISKNSSSINDSNDTSSEESENSCTSLGVNRTQKIPQKIIYESNRRKLKRNFSEISSTSSSKEHDSCYTLFNVSLAVVTAIAIAYILRDKIPKDNSGNSYIANILNIREKFPSQDEDTWSVIRSGLENVIENDLGKVTVFLFLSSNSDQMDTLNELSVDIANIAAEGLGTKSPIIVSEHDILSLPNEQGFFIHKYKSAIEKQKVLLVRDLHKVPANVARSFHFLCDSENPLVKRSIIIFTMHVPDITKKDETLTKVENALHALWSPSLSDNIIHPLITRLTSSIAAITPELIYYKSTVS